MLPLKQFCDQKAKIRPITTLSKSLDDFFGGGLFGGEGQILKFGQKISD